MRSGGRLSDNHLRMMFPRFAQPPQSSSQIKIRCCCFQFLASELFQNITQVILTSTSELRAKNRSRCRKINKSTKTGNSYKFPSALKKGNPGWNKSYDNEFHARHQLLCVWNAQKMWNALRRWMINSSRCLPLFSSSKYHERYPLEKRVHPATSQSNFQHSHMSPSMRKFA